MSQRFNRDDGTEVEVTFEPCEGDGYVIVAAHAVATGAIVGLTSRELERMENWLSENR